MENNIKYYTPKIEDLFEGYEFEYQEYDEEKDEYTDNWIKSGFDSRAGLGHDLTHAFNEGRVRVSFLTVEQLIENGWKRSNFVSGKSTRDSNEYLEKESARNFKPGPDAMCFDCQYVTYYFGITRHVGFPITIVKKTTGGFAGGEIIQTIFYGYLATMNEFRQVCKWLKLK